mmetsp:Transcript_102235/g.294302  ORF Transcript_102235/g.294302 Transcript_102235/m.294302 type:complete len:348 (+) Transcript_102235:601-1644(+)
MKRLQRRWVRAGPLSLQSCSGSLLSSASMRQRNSRARSMAWSCVASHFSSMASVMNDRTMPLMPLPPRAFACCLYLPKPRRSSHSLTASTSIIRNRSRPAISMQDGPLVLYRSTSFERTIDLTTPSRKQQVSFAGFKVTALHSLIRAHSALHLFVAPLCFTQVVLRIPGRATTSFCMSFDNKLRSNGFPAQLLRELNCKRSFQKSVFFESWAMVCVHLWACFSRPQTPQRTKYMEFLSSDKHSFSISMLYEVKVDPGKNPFASKDKAGRSNSPYCEQFQLLLPSVTMPSFLVKTRSISINASSEVKISPVMAKASTVRLCPRVSRIFWRLLKMVQKSTKVITCLWPT